MDRDEMVKREAEEMIKKAYEMARAKVEGFDLMDPEEQHYESYPFYQQLCDEKEAKYWAPVITILEREAKEAQFTDATDPHALWEFQAGEVPDNE